MKLDSLGVKKTIQIEQGRFIDPNIRATTSKFFCLRVGWLNDGENDADRWQMSLEANI